MYYIWVDESDKHGEYYSNFYGGILVDSKRLQPTIQIFQNCIETLHIDEEIKWQKVSPYWFDRYIKIVDILFDLMAKGDIKMRIFFHHNQYVPIGLDQQQKRQEYQLLYYQFIKYAFGLKYSNPDKEDKYVKIYIDNMPLKGSDKETFIDYIYKLNDYSDFQEAHIKIRKEDIVEVDSRDHVLLQVMDLVLGAMCFRLNERHKEKLKDSNKRGRKTIVKEELYKYINKKICEIKPHFNIGISTGFHLRKEIWTDAYRHWSFIPKNHNRDATRTKLGQKNDPL